VQKLLYRMTTVVTAPRAFRQWMMSLTTLESVLPLISDPEGVRSVLRREQQEAPNV
jgi:hypothetical protein